jgi:hypothetical protein
MSKFLEVTGGSGWQKMGSRFECTPSLIGCPNPIAILGDVGQDPEDLEHPTRRFLGIRPEYDSVTGAQDFTVNSVEEASLVIEQFISAYNEQYKVAVWIKARKAFAEMSA